MSKAFLGTITLAIFNFFSINFFSINFFSINCFADQMHYSNVVIGERAQGMGGAYTAVADDASGVVYNPAGLAFAQSNDISGSANAFYNKKVTYKNAILGSQDWTEESGGNFAPFFGAMQKLDKLVPGLVGGFAYYTLDTELKNQDNTLVNQAPIGRYHRAANQRASTWAAVGALAYRISPSLGLGLSMGYLSVDELAQVSQSYAASDGSNYTMSSLRESLLASGIQTALAVQWAPLTKLSVGLTLRSGTYTSQKYKQTVDQLGAQTSASSSLPVVNNASPSEVDTSNPLGTMPLEARAGVAWFASPSLLVALDMDWHDKVSNTDTATSALYTKSAVTNYSVGAEYFVTASTPLRLGLFTNSDASPKIDSGKTNQADHVDYQGSSIFWAWVQPNSQVSVGCVLQQGTGKAQKIAGTTSTQDVKAFAYMLAFSATHSF